VLLAVTLFLAPRARDRHVTGVSPQPTANAIYAVETALSRLARCP
jgi:hypothetical protein